MSKSGIDTVFRFNDSGRIYGVTFIDHQNKVVLNGSRIGKEYSANYFNDMFNSPKQKPENNEQDKNPRHSNDDSQGFSFMEISGDLLSRTCF